MKSRSFANEASFRPKRRFFTQKILYRPKSGLAAVELLPSTYGGGTVS